MLLEKMPAYGGNSAINGGAFAVAGSPLQEKEGIKDSPELMLQDMIKSGRGLEPRRSSEEHCLRYSSCF